MPSFSCRGGLLCFGQTCYRFSCNTDGGCLGKSRRVFGVFVLDAEVATDFDCVVIVGLFGNC